jgi:phage protein D
MAVNAIPDCRVTVDGKDVTDRLRPRLVSISLVEKREGEADQLTIVIDDTDGRTPFPPEGGRITVQLGWKQGDGVRIGLVDKGAFVIYEISHSGPPDIITLTAHAADFTGQMKQRRDASYHATTLGTLVKEIAGRLGLKARCAAKLAGIAVTTKVQSRTSDLVFLRKLGREHDAVATIKRGTLIMSPIGQGVTASGAALPTIAIERSTGDAHQFRIAKREKDTGVTAAWHDRKGAKKQEVTVGDKDGARRLQRTYASEAEAKRAADAARTRAARQPRSLDLTLAFGRADLFPECKVTTTGYEAEIDATRWLIAEVTHSWMDRGFTTGLKLETLLR